ncbi:MAG TPA: hypothetical protein VGD26_11180 [Chitinophagaceae bacterium]
MKIQQGKLDDLIIDMLVHIQSEVQVIRNFVMTDHIEKTGKNVDMVAREYDEMYTSARSAILSQIKSRYVDGFNPDELLAQIRDLK